MRYPTHYFALCQFLYVNSKLDVQVKCIRYNYFCHLLHYTNTLCYVGNHSEGDDAFD